MHSNGHSLNKKEHAQPSRICLSEVHASKKSFSLLFNKIVSIDGDHSGFSGKHNSNESYNVDNGNRFQISICTNLVQTVGQADSLREQGIMSFTENLLVRFYAIKSFSFKL